MASEIERPRVLANFRPSIKDRAQRKRLAPGDRRNRRDGNDDGHLSLIRRMPCIACACERPHKITSPCDPHHLKSGPAQAERGMGRRSSDRWAVPLCRAHHDEVERLASSREIEWFAGLGIDEPWELAAALWRVTNDRDAMIRVLMTHAEIK